MVATAQSIQPRLREARLRAGAEPRELESLFDELEALVSSQSARLKAQEEALHDVYDGMQYALTVAAITGDPNEAKIRGAVRKAQKSYTEAIKRGGE